jgi:hypothetical protein
VFRRNFDGEISGSKMGRKSLYFHLSSLNGSNHLPLFPITLKIPLKIVPSSKNITHSHINFHSTELPTNILEQISRFQIATCFVSHLTVTNSNNFLNFTFMTIFYCLLKVAGKTKELFDKTKKIFLNFSSNNQRCLLQNFLGGKYLLLIRGICYMSKILTHLFRESKYGESNVFG